MLVSNKIKNKKSVCLFIIHDVILQVIVVGNN